jgi:hypothetical protein
MNRIKLLSSKTTTIMIRFTYNLGKLHIVVRVDQLMSLCDELEAGLLRSQTDSERLIRAVVGRMLAG